MSTLAKKFEKIAAKINKHLMAVDAELVKLEVLFDDLLFAQAQAALNEMKDLFSELLDKNELTENKEKK